MKRNPHKTHGSVDSSVNLSVDPSTSPRIAFFGTSDFACIILDELMAASLAPSLIVTMPDRPQGKKLELTPSPVKVWAQAHAIPHIEPEKLSDVKIFDRSDIHIEKNSSNTSTKNSWDLFIVASYGAIIPQAVLDIPEHGTLNVHPSLLPKYRGPSPLQSAILADDKDIGVTIMKLDALMDHGPIIAQEKIEFDTDTSIAITWPPSIFELKHLLGHAGGKLLARTIPLWLSGMITEKAQNHDVATYTKKIEKADGEITIVSAYTTNTQEDARKAYKKFLKIQAFAEWPKAYFFIKKGDKTIRVIISKASYRYASTHSDTGELIIEKVIPEGKQEMSYEDFKRGYGVK